MLTTQDVYNAIDDFAPFDSAEPWDNVGLLVGSQDTQVKGILIALDVTSAVLEEAQKRGANLIVTHHPIIFSPMKQLQREDFVYRVAQKGLDVISAHTNLDMADYGVNWALAKALGLTNTEPLQVVREENYVKIVVFVPELDAEPVYQAMTAAGAGKQGNYQGAGFISKGEGRFTPMSVAQPTIGKIGAAQQVKEAKIEMIVHPTKISAVVQAMIEAHPYEEPGYDIFETHALKNQYAFGLVGELETPMTPEAFAAYVKEQAGAPGVRYIDTQQTVQRVALCGGSGGDMVSTALAKGADAYVTGEVKHHEILHAKEQNICLVEAGHFHTENLFMQPLKAKLLEAFPEANIHCSQHCTDGLKAL